MSNKSNILGHPNRLDMERLYLQGKTISSIAKDFGVSEDQLGYHMRNNLSRQLSSAMAKKELTSSMDMLSEIDSIIIHAKNIFKRNYDKGEDLIALKALDSQRSTFELICKISAYMHQTKLLELQEQQASASQEKDEDFQDKIKILTMPELKMLLKIQDKLERQDRTIIIIPDIPSNWVNPTIAPTNDINISDDEETPVKRLEQPSKSIIQPIKESIVQYNERIQKEEPGKHLFINGRIQRNIDGSY